MLSLPLKGMSLSGVPSAVTSNSTQRRLPDRRPQRKCKGRYRTFSPVRQLGALVVNRSAQQRTNVEISSVARVELISYYRAAHPRCLGVVNEVPGGESGCAGGCPIVNEQHTIGGSEEMAAQCHSLRLVVEIRRRRAPQKRLTDRVWVNVVSDLGETHAKMNCNERPNDKASRFDANDNGDL